MAKYYYKNTEILAPFTIISNEPMFDMTTISLKTRRATQGHQRWELSFRTQPTNNNIEETLLSSVNNLDAETMTMPQLKSVEDRFTLSGPVTLAAQGNANSSTVSLTLSALNSGIIPKGYFVKFVGSDKLHIVTSDTDFNGTSGSITMNIYPKLVSNIASGSSVATGNSVIFSYFKSIDNQTGITFTDGILANSGTITLLEAV
jgi:hypothetical protein